MTYSTQVVPLFASGWLDHWYQDLLLMCVTGTEMYKDRWWTGALGFDRTDRNSSTNISSPGPVGPPRYTECKAFFCPSWRKCIEKNPKNCFLEDEDVSCTRESMCFTVWWHGFKWAQRFLELFRNDATRKRFWWSLYGSFSCQASPPFSAVCTPSYSSTCSKWVRSTPPDSCSASQVNSICVKSFIWVIWTFFLISYFFCEYSTSPISALPPGSPEPGQNCPKLNFVFGSIKKKLPIKESKTKRKGQRGKKKVFS